MKSVPQSQTAFVARDPGTWQGFPGMCLTPAGRLVLGVKQAYGHGASRWQRVVTMVSDDRGRTWTATATLVEGDFDRELPFVATGGLYLTALRDGRVLMHYFTEDWPERKPTTPVVHVSDDAGMTWSSPIRMTPDLQFRQDGAILERRAGDLVVYSGLNRLLRSVDRGETWEPYGDPVVPDDCPLQLAESCLAELADGRLIILMRENHYANFPMFTAASEDGGRTWSRPRPTPFIGHWPDAFDLGDGTHLLAYRNVGGRANSVVWRGDLGAMPEYRVSSCRYGEDGPTAEISADGMVLDTERRPGSFVQFYLMPADDPAAHVVMEAELRCLANAGQACSIGLRGAGWLRIFPDHLDLEHSPGHSRVPVDGRSWHRYRMELERGTLRVSVDGTQVLHYPAIDLAPVSHAPCNAFGCKFDYRELPRPEHYPMRVRLPTYVRPSNAGGSVWRSVRLDITGNRWLPDYRYRWRHDRDGLPDAFQEHDLLELEYCRDAGDWGKPIPVAFHDGECFAVDYFGNGMPVGSDALAWLQPDRGHNCYVNGYRFRLEDLPAPAPA